MQLDVQGILVGGKLVDCKCIINELKIDFFCSLEIKLQSNFDEDLGLFP